MSKPAGEAVESALVRLKGNYKEGRLADIFKRRKGDGEAALVPLALIMTFREECFLLPHPL